MSIMNFLQAQEVNQIGHEKKQLKLLLLIW